MSWIRAFPRMHFPSDRSLYVSGLNLITGKSELKQYFQNFGKVSKTHIVLDNRDLSRGVGFVRFADESSCTAALEYEEHMLDGRRFRVEPKNNQK